MGKDRAISTKDKRPQAVETIKAPILSPGDRIRIRFSYGEYANIPTKEGIVIEPCHKCNPAVALIDFGEHGQHPIHVLLLVVTAKARETRTDGPLFA